jgi:hypothetical protein
MAEAKVDTAILTLSSEVARIAITQKSPFCNPPIDVLVSIFEHALPYYSKARDVPLPDVKSAPLNISHVCRYWREASLLTPQLWSTIVVTEHINLDLTLEMINRSAHRPLDIFIHVKPNSKFHQISMRKLVFVHEKLFRNHFNRSRWRYVYCVLPLVSNDERGAISTKLLRERMRMFAQGFNGLNGGNLEELTIHISDHTEWWYYWSVNERHRHEPIVVGAPLSPVIKRLDLSGVLIKLQVDALIQYTRLRKIHLRIGEHTPTESYLSLLAAAPNLEDLCIKFPSLDEDDTPIVQKSNVPPKTFSRLRYLYLHNSHNFVSSQMLSTIVAAIDAPNLERLRIYDRTFPTDNPAVVKLGDALRGLLSRTSSSTSLTDVDIYSNIREGVLIEYLGMLPAVRTLAIQMLNCTTDLMTALMAPRPDVEAPPARVPLLRKLSIRCRSFLASEDQVLAMLLSRTEFSSSHSCERLQNVSLGIPNHEFDVRGFILSDDVKDLMKSGLQLLIKRHSRPF